PGPRRGPVRELPQRPGDRERPGLAVRFLRLLPDRLVLPALPAPSGDALLGLRPPRDVRPGVRTSFAIRRARKSDGPAILGLIDALADYEKLKRPGRAARARLLKDAFGPRRRFDVLLAVRDGKALAYAVIFETYST